MTTVRAIYIIINTTFRNLFKHKWFNVYILKWCNNHSNSTTNYWRNHFKCIRCSLRFVTIAFMEFMASTTFHHWATTQFISSSNWIATESVSSSSYSAGLISLSGRDSSESAVIICPLFPLILPQIFPNILWPTCLRQQIQCRVTKDM